MPRCFDVENIDGDFTACSVDVLNTFFAAYRNAHSQGGTNTRQCNLHHLFKWPALRYDHPDPSPRTDATQQNSRHQADHAALPTTTAVQVVMSSRHVPRVAMSLAASGGRTSEPVTKEAA
jgi:hypothetical protein